MVSLCDSEAAERFASGLSQSLDEVLSTMFFAEMLGEIPCAEASAEDTKAEDTKDVPPGKSPEKPMICAALSFSGSLNGALHIAVPVDVAVTLAGDFSGCDAPQETDAIGYTVCELANMICGSALSKFEPDAHVVLTAPELCCEPFVPGWQTRWFELMDGVLALSVRLD